MNLRVFPIFSPLNDEQLASIAPLVRLRRLDRDTPDAVLAAAALASLAVAKGHAGIRLGAADALVEAALASGGRDNVTVIVLDAVSPA